MTYEIEILSKPRRQIKALPKDIQNLVRVKIRSLAENPRPPGVKKLSGIKNLYRVRVGEYRIIYDIQDRVLVVVIVSVGHRSKIYRS
jgi:mRNA interferase RelE/StbE